MRLGVSCRGVDSVPGGGITGTAGLNGSPSDDGVVGFCPLNVGGDASGTLTVGTITFRFSGALDVEPACCLESSAAGFTVWLLAGVDKLRVVEAAKTAINKGDKRISFTTSLGTSTHDVYCYLLSAFSLPYH